MRETKGLLVVVCRTMVYGEKEYSDKCGFMCVFNKACDAKCLPYMRVHICGSCAEFMPEGSAKKFCFNDLGIPSSENSDLSFIAKTFSVR